MGSQVKWTWTYEVVLERYTTILLTYLSNDT